MRIHKKRIVLYVFIFSLGSLAFIYVKNKPNITEHSASKNITKEFVRRPYETLSADALQIVRSKMINAMIKHAAQSSKQAGLNDPSDRVKMTLITILPKTSSTTIETTTALSLSENTFVSTDKHSKMRLLHRSVINKISEDEIIEYYNRERESENKFSRILNIKEDRKLLSSLFPSRDEKSDRVTDQLRLKLNTSDIKTILVIGLDETNKKVKENDCNIAACNVIHDSKRFHEADVVVYKDVVPLLSKEYSRTQNQIITWFQIESALNYPFVTSKTILNWTATYRHDSVLNTPYERFTPFLNITTLPSKPQRNFARGKKKLVAWFVSNCGGSNQRMEYVKELQKHISVDIYGGCGPLKCNRKNKECFQKLKNDYKFYLAFENTNCVDYITEKLFWNAYLNDVVPIVMGAHPNDYKRSAPPRSFIHVDYFKSPKELASYLNYLDAHDDLYNSFFLWKGTGEFINTKFVCRLCAMAHLAPHFPMWYKNIRNWWSNDNLCETKVEGKYATWKHRQTPNTSVANKEIVYGYARK